MPSGSQYCGHAILFCGAAISFGSQLMKIAAQSSREVEIYAYVLAANDLRFLQQVLEFLGLTLDLPTPIFTDSTTAESWIKNPGATARSRHYEKFLMCARKQYLNKISHPKWISGQNQIADIPRRSTRPTSSASAMLYEDSLELSADRPLPLLVSYLCTFPRAVLLDLRPSLLPLFDC